MPASKPIRQTPLHVTPGGSAHQPMRTIRKLAPMMPSGLPATSAIRTPSITVIEPLADRSMPSSETPAFASANMGMMPKATYGCRAICTRLTGGSKSRCAWRNCFKGSARWCGSALSFSAWCNRSFTAVRAISSGWISLRVVKTGVINPSTTPASVGCAPVFNKPNHSTAPGST
ncbi:hypothetical protein D3C81_1357300 [compost metagenome]